MNPQTISNQPKKSSSAHAAYERLIAGLPVASRRLRLAGVNTTLLEGGDGAPMVLLHGPGGYAATWRRVIPDLVGSNRVIVPDLPGHGTSEVVEGTLDPDDMIAWLDDLIELTGDSPPVVVGHGLGGALALRHAVAHPGRSRRLVVVDSLGLVPFQPLPEFGAALHRFFSDPNATNHQTLWQQCAYDLDTLQRTMGEIWEPFETYNLDRARTPKVMAAVTTLLETVGSPIPPSQLLAIETPVTLVWGRHDRAIPLSVAEQASARYGWPLVIIEDSADDPPIEQPEALVRALR